MTASLPTVGGSNNTWGTQMNNFLGVSLNSDGTINPAAISNAGGTLTTFALTGVLSGTLAAPTFTKAPANSFAPGNPAAYSTNTSLVMAGVGNTCQYTPSSSGTIFMVVTAFGTTNTSAVSFTVGLRRGAVSGGVPAYGVGATGTRIASSTDPVLQSASTAAVVPFSFTTVLSLSAANWFDLVMATSSTGAPVQLSNIRMSFVETA